MVMTITVASSEVITVTSHDGLSNVTVQYIKATKAPLHASSSGRATLNTLQNTKKCATTKPITKLIDHAVDQRATDAIAPTTMTTQSTIESRKPG